MLQKIMEDNVPAVIAPHFEGILKRCQEAARCGKFLISVDRPPLEDFCLDKLRTKINEEGLAVKESSYSRSSQGYGGDYYETEVKSWTISWGTNEANHADKA